MQNFSCRCGAAVFFDNTRCLSCGRNLGLRPHRFKLLSFHDNELPRGLRRCRNAEALGCNWLVERKSAAECCLSCELNTEPATVPDESETQLEQRRETERSKRRLLYSLLALGLPVVSKKNDPKWGLAFALKRPQPDAPVVTGHDDGLITLSLSEADHSEREKVRASMKERYRTLLGHFRHEIGHYFWYLLVQDRAPLPTFRETFGDERADYAQALKKHYEKSDRGSFDDRFVSQYASSHPWEDFAETFAHYLHMVDTLDTASHEGFTNVVSIGRPAKRRFDRMLAEWYHLSVALNSLNRSMGVHDAYPFAIPPAVAAKLRYIHALVHAERSAARPWYSLVFAASV